MKTFFSLLCLSHLFVANMRPYLAGSQTLAMNPSQHVKEAATLTSVYSLCSTVLSYILVDVLSGAADLLARSSRWEHV